MKPVVKFGCVIVAVVMVLGVAAAALAADEVQIVGTVGDDNTITDESGAVYKLAEGDLATQIAEHAGDKVEIKGAVQEAADGTKTITVTSFKPME
jgi:hypothetical protein